MHALAKTFGRFEASMPWRHFAALLALMCAFVPVLGASVAHAADDDTAAPNDVKGPDLFEWATLPPLPDKEGFAGMFAGVSHDVLIAAGGANFPEAKPWEGGTKVWTDAIYLYQPGDELTEGHWTIANEKLPRPLGYGVSVSYNDRVICVGGSDANQHYPDVFAMRCIDEEYTEAGQKKVRKKIVFEPLPALPAPCANMCGAVVGTTLYIAGGTESPTATQAMHTFWALDLAAPAEQRAWKELEPWPGPGRHLAVAAGHRNQFYLISGIALEANEDGQAQRLTPYLVDAYRYTPARDDKPAQWEKLADLPRGVAAAPSPAMPVSPTHLAIVGGDHALPTVAPQDHPGFTRDAQVYNIKADTWTIRADVMPEGSSRVTAPTVYWHQNWLVVSGEKSPGVRSPDIHMASPAPVTFGTLNWIVLCVYLAGMVGIGAWCSKRSDTTEDFFLAGKRIPWWAAGLSIFGTQLSAITFMTIPALAYTGNWVALVGNWLIAGVAPIVIFFYLPFFRRLNVVTAYEYLEKRFDVLVRLFGSATYIFFQFARVGIVLYLPALALSAVAGIDIYLCILLMGIFATIYTVMGGMEAVIWTDVAQVIVLVGGAVLCIFTILAQVGGLGELIRMGSEHEKFHMVTWSLDPKDTAIWVAIIGFFFLNLLPYTSDQTVIQRYLTTRDEKQAARSIWTNGLLCIPTGVLFFLLGTALFVFYQTHADALVPDQSDRIVPWFVVHELPAGIAGLVIAGVFAAAMSSLDSSMNSVAAAGVTDFYRRFNRHATDRQCLNLSRIITVIVGVAGTGIAMGMAFVQSKSLFDLFQEVLGLFLGGLGGLFVLAVFTRRANQYGALIGACAGAAATFLARGHVHPWLHAAIGVITTVVVGYIASLLIPAPPKDLTGLTLHTMRRGEPAPQRA